MNKGGLGTAVKKVKRARPKRAQYMDYVIDQQGSGKKALPIKKWMATQK